MNTYRNKQFKNGIDPKYVFNIAWVIANLRVILKSL